MALLYQARFKGAFVSLRNILRIDMESLSWQGSVANLESQKVNKMDLESWAT